MQTLQLFRIVDCIAKKLKNILIIIEQVDLNKSSLLTKNIFQNKQTLQLVRIVDCIAEKLKNILMLEQVASNRLHC
jgi:hypothetical protein